MTSPPATEAEATVARPTGRGTPRSVQADRVAAMGGLLELHSPPGGGTRLVSDLPSEAAGGK